MGKRPSLVASSGAVLILLGTLVSAAPQLLPSVFPAPVPAAPGGGGGGDASGSGGAAPPGAPPAVYWYSVVIFFSAQLFLSSEKVFEEMTFHKYTIDIFYMFFWTLVTQVTLGWIYYPIQTFKAFGGLDLSSIPYVIIDGTLCTFGITSNHGLGPTAIETFESVNPGGECGMSFPLLFFSYCTIDYCCYAMGLYVIQRGGANLMILASAISLPLTQLVLCMPFMGSFTQTFVFTDAAALALCLSGFAIYQKCSPEGIALLKGN
eukprot:SAG22_NODE_1776_length_3607_cov_2.601482_1_plen_263_part_10